MYIYLVLASNALCHLGCTLPDGPLINIHNLILSVPTGPTARDPAVLNSAIQPGAQAPMNSVYTSGEPVVTTASTNNPANQMGMS